MLVSSSAEPGTPWGQSKALRWLAILIVFLAAGAYTLSLDRNPGFYVDDAVFAYPAYSAAQGGAFVYPVSSKAPYSMEVWAYHGPVLPHLEFALFKVFGFSILATRLPEFLGGWSGCLLLVLFLIALEYRYASLAFVWLWAGDRAPMEIMYGRMEGLAMFALVVLFLILYLALSRKSTKLCLLAGIIAGICPLIHPLTAPFLLAAAIIVLYFLGIRAAVLFVIGAASNLLILLALYRHNLVAAGRQFLWHSMYQKNGAPSFVKLLHMLHWGWPWFCALILLSLWFGFLAIQQTRKQRLNLTAFDLSFVLASIFGLAGLAMFLLSAKYPYYLVFFTCWPVLALAMYTERNWEKSRMIALVALLWIPSAMWNAMRMRESIMYHSQLKTNFLYAEVNKIIPAHAEIGTIPEMYSVPIETGHPEDLSTSSRENEDLCPSCYLLVTASEFDRPEYISASNLQSRTILYTGPAFPGAHQLDYPIVILSPENSLPPIRPIAQ